MSSRTVLAAKTHELMLVSFMFVFVRPACEDFIRNKFVKIDAMLQLPCSILGCNFFKKILAEFSIIFPIYLDFF